ncbi:MAG: hypothetical protein GDA40_09680 [Rhodobacteraceae bacterium]|nr:hypothetical protein [Paracoccaceae bacterium]
MRDLEVPQNERGQLRVFAVNLTPEEVRPLLLPEDPAHPEPISRPKAEAAATLFGTDPLDPMSIELFALSGLDGVELPRYLIDGHGIPQEQITPDRARLAALEGYAMIVLSDVFRTRPARIALGAALTLIGTYGQPATDWTSSLIATTSAAPRSGVTPSPRDVRHAARKRGATVFAIVMTTLVLVLFWLVL